MRASSVVGALLLPLFVACVATPPHDHDASFGSLASPLHGAPSDARELWEVRLEGGSAVEAWLAAPPSLRAARSRARLAELAVERLATRPFIEAHGEVVGDLTRLVNGLLVLATPAEAARIAEIPGVAQIARAQVFSRALASAVPTIGAPQAWNGADGVLGEGVTIGIIDSGVDYLHADLGGDGDPSSFDANDPTLIEPGSFPTARVVGGWDFAGDDYDASNPAKVKPTPDPDPLDCVGSGGEYAGGHGTHVATIAAGTGVKSDGTPYDGPYDASLALHSLAIAPGVAPKASLVALRVFGCGGSTGLVPLALERAADPNLDGDFSDRLDVVNMSLGSAYGLGAELNSDSLAKLHALDSLLVVAAGNDGDATFDIGYPGSRHEVLTVAATEARPWVPLHVDAPASIAGTYPAAEGPISKPLVDVGTLTGDVVAANPPKGCTSATNGAELAGKIALLERGECSFAYKLATVREAGAIGAIVIDDMESPEPPVMGGMSSVDLPAVGIRKAHGEAIAGALAQGVSVRLVGGERYEGLGSEAMTGFSSRGPAPRELALKPDVSAPGANLVAAKVGSGTGAVAMSGTSMACPVVAGAAALVREQRPELAADDVKALLVGTATSVGAASGARYALTRQGGGRIAVDRATTVRLRAHADGEQRAPSLTFGALVSATPISATRTARFFNDGDEPVTLTLDSDRVDALPGVAVSLSTSALTLPPGGSATVDVTLSLDPDALGAPPPDALTPATVFEFDRHYLNEAMGFVRASSGDATVRLPYYGVVRAAATRHAVAVTECASGGAPGELRLSLEGASAHPTPAVSAFELGVLDEEKPKSKTDPLVAAVDLRAVGIASDFATKLDVAETTVMFAVATAGPWSTPAAGPFSPVGILVDIDSDPAYEFIVTAAPFSSEHPFVDVLVTEVFDAKGKRVGERRYLNMAPRGDADTAPFVNDVLVLPVFARDIGLSETRTAFRYAAYGERIDTAQTDDETDWAEHDLTRPRVDPAALAPTAGRPLFVGADTIPLRLGATPSDAGAPSVLVLHHNNAPGERWDAVSLEGPSQELLAVEIDERPAEGARIVRRVTVTNQGTRRVDGVTLTGTVAGGRLELVAPSQGTCANEAIACTLGALLPGATASVGVTVEAEEGAAVKVEVQTTSANGCVTEAAGVVAPATADVGLVPDLSVTGGCACRATPTHPQRTEAPWLLVAASAAVGLARARRRR